MADTRIKLRRSAVPFKIPSDNQLQFGEVAINTFDGKMYFKQANTTNLNTNTILEVVTSNFSGNAVINGFITGTAVTANDADSTPNRLLKVGDFGLGFQSAPSITEFNIPLTNGMYRFLGSAANNGPDAAAWQHTSLVMHTPVNGATALVMRNGGSTATNARMYMGMRNTANGSFTWQQVALSDITNTFSAAQTFNGIISGTAVTQTNIDTTANRLVKVGDFGLGSTGTPGIDTPSITDFTVELAAGFYRYLESNAVGAPDTQSYYGTAVVMRAALENTTVLATRWSSTASGMKWWLGTRSTATGALTWLELPSASASMTWLANHIFNGTISGTAVTQTNIDTTANRLVKVGDYGLSTGIFVASANLDLLYVGLNYGGYGGAHALKSTGDNPYPASGGAFNLMVLKHPITSGNTTYTTQISFPNSGSPNVPKFRFTTSPSVWSSWREFAVNDVNNIFRADQEIATVAPTLYLNDTDATANSTVFTNMANKIIFEANGVSVGTVGFDTGTTLLTRNLYGNLRFLADNADSSTNTIIDFWIDNSLAAQVFPAGTASVTAQSVMTREKADERYVLTTTYGSGDTIKTPIILNPFIADATDPTRKIHLLADNVDPGLTINIRVPTSNGTLALINDVAPIINSAISGLDADNPVFEAWTPIVKFANTGITFSANTNANTIYSGYRAGNSFSHQYRVDITASINDVTINYSANTSANNYANGDLLITGFPVSAAVAPMHTSIIATCQGLVKIPWWAKTFKFVPVEGQNYGKIVYSNSESIWSIPFSCVAGQRLHPGDYIATNSSRHATVRHVEFSTANTGTIFLADVLNDATGAVTSIPSGNTLTSPTGQVFTTTGAQTLVSTINIPVSTVNIPTGRTFSIWFGGSYFK